MGNMFNLEVQTKEKDVFLSIEQSIKSNKSIMNDIKEKVQLINQEKN